VQENRPTRRGVLLGTTAVLTAFAGCSGAADGSDGNDGEDAGTTPTPPDSESGTDSSDGDSGDAQSCASLFGDAMETYDTGDRGMIATFSYPAGGEILTEQDVAEADEHGTGIGYGRGEISSLHDLTVFEHGPTGEPVDPKESYAFDDRFEGTTVTTYDGGTRPAVVRRLDDSVTYIFHVERPDGVYVFDVTAGTGEGDPCLDTYESVARRVTESFEPVA
jgi:hypothetical protein